MAAYDERIDSPNPFWFAREELLTDFMRSEAGRVGQLLVKHPDFRGLFDAPEATVSQRRACFAILAHRKVVEMIDDTFTARYQESPSLGNKESTAFRCTHNLVAADAPTWVLEMNQVVERLPDHIYASLPEPLRRGGFGFSRDDTEQVQAIRSATDALNSVDQIEALIDRVLDQQLQRLERRWSASISAISQSQPVQQPRTTSVTLVGQARRMNKREGWEQKLKLYRAIQNALSRDSSPQGIEFCAELDKRHAPPLVDWVKKGEWREGLTWKEAWTDRRLRKKIRRVRQEAMKRRLESA